MTCPARPPAVSTESHHTRVGYNKKRTNNVCDVFFDNSFRHCVKKTSKVSCLKMTCLKCIKLCLHQSTGTKMSKLSNRTLPTCILSGCWGGGISKHLNPEIILQCWHEGISSLNLIIQEEMSVLHSVCYRFHPWGWSVLAVLFACGWA